ncbi:hypothetical protein FH5_05236 [Priestia endophytica]|nr:hypothetical protein FH5_05236 [Priestia endophytica]
MIENTNYRKWKNIKKEHALILFCLYECAKIKTVLHYYILKNVQSYKSTMKDL